MGGSNARRASARTVVKVAAGTDRRTAHTVVAFTTLLVMLVSCAGQPSQESAPEEVLKIGILSIETGFFASLGIPFQTAKQIAVDEVNSAGGLQVGATTYQVELDIQDTKLDVPTALAITRKMVEQDDIKFIITVGDPISTAVVPLTAPNQVLLLAETWNLDPLRKEDPSGQYTFGTLSTPLETSAVFFEALGRLHPEAVNVAFIGPDFAFSRTQFEQTQAGAETVNSALNFLEPNYYASDGYDAPSVAQRTLDSEPDIVLMGSVGLDGAPLIRALRDLGYDGLLGTTYAQPSSAQLLSAFQGQEEMLDGYLAVEGQHYIDPSAQKDLIDTYSSLTAGSDIPSEGTPTFYVGILTLFQAMKDAGTVTDTLAVAQALENVEVTTPVWTDAEGNELPITYGGEEKLGWRRQIQIPVAVNVIENGQVTTLDVEIATVP